MTNRLEVALEQTGQVFLEMAKEIKAMRAEIEYHNAKIERLEEGRAFQECLDVKFKIIISHEKNSLS